MNEVFLKTSGLKATDIVGKLEHVEIQTEALLIGAVDNNKV